jgi:hypothetical protein
MAPATFSISVFLKSSGPFEPVAGLGRAVSHFGGLSVIGVLHGPQVGQASNQCQSRLNDGAPDQTRHRPNHFGPTDLSAYILGLPKSRPRLRSWLVLAVVVGTILSFAVFVLGNFMSELEQLLAHGFNS